MPKKVGWLGKKKISSFIKDDVCFSVFVEEQGMICPYCVTMLPIKEGDPKLIDKFAAHLSEKCSVFEGFDMPTAELKTLNQRKQAHETFAEVKKKIKANPAWHIFDSNGTWYCPFCAEPTKVKYSGNKAELKDLPKKYYTSTKQYLQSKCQTYDQKIYHYKRGADELVGQCCVPGCNRVYYKPNNSAFATDGAVSSSAQILRTQVNTIEKAAYNTIRATGTRNKFIHKMFNEIPSRCCY